MPRPLLPALALLVALAGSRAAAQPTRPPGAAPRVVAPDSSRPRPVRPFKVALSISGGISLGAYQAGVNWALVQTMRRLRDDAGFAERLRERRVVVPNVELVSVAGASAGNINALLSAAAWCEAASDSSPEASLFWTTWITTGLPQLFPYSSQLAGGRRFGLPFGGRGQPFDVAKVFDADTMPDQQRGYVFSDTGQALFNRVYFRDVLYPTIRRRLDAPTHRVCDVPVGITVTRVVPDTFPVETRLQAAVQRFASVVRVRSGEPSDSVGRARVPLGFEHATHDVRHGRRLGALIDLASDSSPRIPVDTVLGLVEASSAFPLAFAPRLLSYYNADSLYFGIRLDAAASSGAARDGAARDGAARRASPADTLPCAALGRFGPCAQPKRAQFIDGGVFDNNPVSLALDLLNCRYAVRRQGVAGCPSEKDATDSVTAEVVFINPAAVRPPLRATGPAQFTDTSTGLSEVVHFGLGAVQSARQYELQVLGRRLAQMPEAQADTGDIIRPTTRAFPIVGTNLFAFAAFLGRPFREHDFAVGAYDGLRYAIREFICNDSTQWMMLRADTAPDRRAVAHRLGAADVLDACIAQELRLALTGEYVPLTPAIGQVMRTVFTNEFPHSFPPRLPTPLGERDSLEAALVGSAALANAEFLGRRVPRGCEGHDIVYTVLCAGDFNEFLERYSAILAANPLAGGRDVVARALALPLVQHTGEDCSSLAAVSEPAPCLVDPVFADFLGERHHFTNQLILELLRRQWLVERGQQRRAAQMARSQPDVEAGMTGPVELLELWYYTSNERYRRGVDLDPSTIPAYESGWLSPLRLFPYHYSGGIGTGGLGFGWRPTIYFPQAPLLPFPHEHYAIVFPIDVWRFRSPRSVASPELGWQYTLGGGLYYQTHNFAFSGVQLSVFGGGDMQFKHAFALARPRFGRDDIGGDAVAQLLGGKIRLGAHWFPRRDWRQTADRKVAAIVGVSDLNGLLYWGLRQLH